jgi:hypothetical protein
VAMIPLFVLRLLGTSTSYFDERLSLWLWVFVSTTPGITAFWAWLLDRRENQPPPMSDLCLIPLLIPYVLVLLGISWMCLLDEFVWQWPFAYVKTPRAGDLPCPRPESLALSDPVPPTF